MLHSTIGDTMTTLICTKSWSTCRKAVALLEQHNIAFEYREYKKNPLSLKELQNVMQKLNIAANTLLRKRDKAYKENNLNGKESDATLLPLFVENPGLMQRPILVHNDKAIVGRPIENMLTIV